VYYYGDDSVIVQQELRAISIRHQRAATHIQSSRAVYIYAHTFAALAKPNFAPLPAINDHRGES
jgi:hypothetical protein